MTVLRTFLLIVVIAVLGFFIYDYAQRNGFSFRPNIQGPPQNQNPYQPPPAPTKPRMSEADLAFLDELQDAGELIVAYHDGKDQEALAMCESLELEIIQVYAIARFLTCKWPERTDVGSLTYEYAIFDILRRSSIIRYLEPNHKVIGKVSPSGTSSGYEANNPFRVTQPQ